MGHADFTLSKIHQNPLSLQRYLLLPQPNGDLVHPVESLFARDREVLAGSTEL
jgi:hypothetical protein